MKRRNKLLAMVLSVIMVLSIIPVIPLTASAETEGIFNYEVNDGEATVTGLVDEEYSGAIEIPSTIGGCPVTSIGEGAFDCCSGLTYITIPDSVTSIGECAFEYCSGLTSITIPNSVTSIGAWAFEGCSGLTSITIPNSITSIGEYAFEGCSGLTSITIPNSVTSIGDEAFGGCSGLESITVETGNPVYHSAGNCLIETESKTIIAGCQNSIIPDDGSVTVIGRCAFADCDKLKAITIPDSVTSIGEYAFQNCSLTSVTIPDSVTEMLQGAFSYCGRLTLVTIGNSVDYIGDYAFEDCFGLKTVVITGPSFSIWNFAFDRCWSLKDVYFAGTEQQKSECYIGYSNDYLVNAAWHYNYRPGDQINTPYNQYDLCKYRIDIDEVMIIGLVDDNYSGDVEIPATISGYPVKGIVDSAFLYCSGIKSITIPSTVTYIGSSAFYGCDGLTDIYYNGTQQQRYEINIFAGNDYLENATWHYAGGSEEESFAQKCASALLLTTEEPVEVSYNGTEDSGVLRFVPEESGEYSFTSEGNCDTYITLYDESGESIAYNDDGGNGNNFYLTTELEDGKTYFLFTRLYDSENSGDYTVRAAFVDNPGGSEPGTEGEFYYEVNDGEATITGFSNRDYSGEITIPSTIGGYPVTSIGQNAFGDDCDSYQFTNVIIPDSVTSIGNDAFGFCYKLTNITIPDSVTSIGAYAFEECTRLTSIILPNNITSIENWVFAYCKNLESITIPNSVTSIGNGAFYRCSGLESIIVESGNTVYHSNGNCLIETDSKRLVAGCKNSIIPNDGSVTSIGDCAFEYCSGLTSITIPNSVTSIGDYAFYDCSGLTDVYYGGTEQEKANIDIYVYGNSCLLDATWHYNYIPEAHTPGDINGDGAVNNKDLTRLFQYLSDWDVEVEKVVLDVNGDGSVNNKDLTRLFQYLSDWDVEIF